MSKYDPLQKYLQRLDVVRKTLSFKEIEAILEEPLPESARKYEPWWANDRTHTQARAWLEIDWHTEAVKLHKEEVTFYKI